MSSTVQCTESSRFTVKNVEEVKEVLEELGMEVFSEDNSIQFFGDENNWFDDNAEVVLSLIPITINDKKTNLIGLIADTVCEPIDLDTLEEGTYMVQSITEYLQDQLLEGGYISIKCAGFTMRLSGSCEPFGDITVITKNKIDFSSIYRMEEEMLK